VKKQLLAGGEDEVLPAVHAFEYLVLEFHDPVACRRDAWLAAPALLEKRTELARARHRSGLLQLHQPWGRRSWRGTTCEPLRTIRTEPETPRARDCWTNLRARGMVSYRANPALYAPFSGYASAPVLP
jgi:hypothetical protein